VWVNRAEATRESNSIREAAGVERLAREHLGRVREKRSKPRALQTRPLFEPACTGSPVPGEKITRVDFDGRNELMCIRPDRLREYNIGGTCRDDIRVNLSLDQPESLSQRRARVIECAVAPQQVAESVSRCASLWRERQESEQRERLSRPDGALAQRVGSDELEARTAKRDKTNSGSGFCFASQ